MTASSSFKLTMPAGHIVKLVLEARVGSVESMREMAGFGDGL